jgi:predicted GNAT family acetyltransferase
MTESTESEPAAFEYPDEAGYPDGRGTLSQDQIVLVKEVAQPHAPAFDFEVVKDENTGTYDAIVGDREIGALTYDVAADGRLVLLATSIVPEFRQQGLATELIKRVLDDIRSQGRTITIVCPIVRAFIERNPAYRDLVDLKHPGVTKGPINR